MTPNEIATKDDIERLERSIKAMAAKMLDELAAQRKQEGPEIIGVKEAAEILNVSQDTVRRRVRAGEIPCKVIKGRYRFKRRDLI